MELSLCGKKFMLCFLNIVSFIKVPAQTLPNKMGELRENKQLLEITRALRFQSSLPKHFWGYCLLATTYIIYKQIACTCFT